jgi:hypothetical protein
LRESYDIREDPESFNENDGQRKPRKGKLENIFIVEYCGPARQKSIYLPKPQEMDDEN